MEQIPKLVSQVIADLTFAEFILFLSKSSAKASSIKVPFLIFKLPSFETMSSAKTLPNILSLRDWTTSPPSIIVLISRPSFVPQSSSLMTKSWATSTNLLVK